MSPLGARGPRRPARRLLHGARQTGKSTLAAFLAAADHRARYLTLDDAAVLAAAHADPTGFIDSLAGGAVVLHEVQRAPELLLPIKVSVDRGRRPISRSARIPLTTLKRYLALFELKRYLALFVMTFLVQLVPPWFTSLGKRLVKTPSCTVADSGLLAYLLGMTSERLTLDSTVAGPVLESFAVMEIRKQLAWSTVKPRLFYFRTSTDDEVDVVLEGRGGKLTAVEIKASATIGGATSRPSAAWPRRRESGFIGASCCTPWRKRCPSARSSTPFRSAPSGGWAPALTRQRPERGPPQCPPARRRNRGLHRGTRGTAHE